MNSSDYYTHTSYKQIILHEGPCKIMLLCICSPTHYLHLEAIHEQCNKKYFKISLCFFKNNK